jgi:proteasome lid subunit RPN8/RPN11
VKLEIKVKNDLIEGILAYSRDMHPKEFILLLRGESEGDIEVNEVVIPPLAVHGPTFSEFKPHMIPFDLSIVGLAHSHPSGVLKPSIYDLNHFYGRIMMITAYPYRSIEDAAIFDRDGRTLPFKTVE